MGGWSPSDNKANLSSTRLKLDLTTRTELGKNPGMLQPRLAVTSDLLKILKLYAPGLFHYQVEIEEKRI